MNKFTYEGESPRTLAEMRRLTKFLASLEDKKRLLQTPASYFGSSVANPEVDKLEARIKAVKNIIAWFGADRGQN